jgi:hypothetical protein
MRPRGEVEIVEHRGYVAAEGAGVEDAIDLFDHAGVCEAPAS